VLDPNKVMMWCLQSDMERQVGERFRVLRGHRRFGTFALVVALIAGGTLVASALSKAASPSAPGSAASGPSATGGAGSQPVAFAEPRMKRVTRASIGDPLFPGLGNGGYDVQRYDLRLTYRRKDPKQTITGSETIIARATQDLRALDLDATSRSGISGVTVDGRPALFSLRNQDLAITPSRPLARGRPFTVGVRHFTATPTSPNVRNVGVASFLSTRDGTALAGQPNAMHLFFPCNDHPSDKAAFDVTVDAPAGWTAVVSGDLVGRPRTSGGRTRWHYREDQPMATELLQVAVGAYTVERRGSVGGVAVRDVVPTRLAGPLLAALDVQSKQVRWMVSKIGPYPFDTYGSLVVDGRLGFSLETQTLSIHDAELVTADNVSASEGVLLHELAHQWFGDSVSPGQWSDVWLNEGHATWYQELWSAEEGHLLATDDAWDLEALMSRIYAASTMLRDRYGPPGKPKAGGASALFNDDVYSGGALVLYALRQEIGQAEFAEVERRWVATHRHGVATSADYAALASQVAGRDLTPFFNAWLYARETPPMPGHPDWTSAPTPSPSPSKP
jgi:aminopeptidase N